MDQESIGKFIAKLRKSKNMTQEELAEKLGVTDRSVSNWENGRNMPDLSLFKPLCEELGVTINDLMSGEIVDNDKYQEKLEENIVNTIDYSIKKANEYKFSHGLTRIILGIFLCVLAIIACIEDSSFGVLFCIFGIAIVLTGVFRLTWKMQLYKRVLLTFITFIGISFMLLVTDYTKVKNNSAPIFRNGTMTITSSNGTSASYYDGFFYDVIRCEYKYNIVENKDYSEEEINTYCLNSH